MEFRDSGWKLVTLALFIGFNGLCRGEEIPSADTVGNKVPDFVFQEEKGEPLPLHTLQGKKATVLIFLSGDCEIAQSYTQLLTEMAKAYSGRGIAFIGLIPDAEDKAGIKLNVGFPLVRDNKNMAGEALKARVLSEVFVLDADLVLRYRGRIDDAFAERLKRKLLVSHHDLAQALDELLAGKSISTPATVAKGCPIDFTMDTKASGKVTFHRDVLPILQNHCQACHRPGEVGPFSLLTYRQASRWARDIKDYTQSRKMPPWKPVDGPAFYGERKLTDQEIAILAAWVDGGRAEGDVRDSPAPRPFIEGWQLGQPDLILSADNDLQIGPTGNDVFRCFVLPTYLANDTYVTGVEVRPGNRRIVHHTLQFLDNTRQGRKLEQKEKDRHKEPGDKDSGPGYSVAMGVGFRPLAGMGGWAPGQVPHFLPENTGYFLPKGTDIVLQVHYHRDGRLEKDRTTIGLYFAKKPLAHSFQGLVIPGRIMYIPAGEEHFRVTGSMWVRQDCTLHSVMPHMHMLGREVKITMNSPDGVAQTLVAIQDWDYNWQETYFFQKPIPVKAGTRFDIEAIYDNSAKNPNNPNQPPRMMFYGEQTTNEMLFGFLGATSELPGRIRFDAKYRKEKKVSSLEKKGDPVR